MSGTIGGTRTELGRVLQKRGVPDGVHVNVVGQDANTLLHDGHAWKDFARKALSGARRAVRADAGHIVHASFAFVLGEPERDPLRSLVRTILECESIVRAGPVPACIVRLGYLYGPDSRDLVAYRAAFRLRRPYWAGPRKAVQFHLHHLDAADALIAAARPRNAGRTFFATDDLPAPFMQLMDDFARRNGTRLPLHVPRIATPVIRLIVREEHMQQAALAMPGGVPGPRVPGWRPAFPSYREGLAQVLAAWKR
jgi:nucleoside-diphosphate-sugar epimerase